MFCTDEVDAGSLLATVVVEVILTVTGLVGVAVETGFLFLSPDPFGKQYKGCNQHVM